MPAAYWDDASEDLDDYEYPDIDHPEDDDAETVPCPECGADVYEDADQCPACGMYLNADTRAWSDKPLWWIVLAVLGMIAIILTLVLGL